ncbi:MAG: hypothetical protein J7L79_03425 [Thaumarchaeota archaeon]|nr:hypothetical protein [Nitrososphaerota archaeon]
MEEIVDPLLKEVVIVVSDRCLHSSLTPFPLFEICF